MPLQSRIIGTDSVSAIGIGAMSFADFYGPTTEENSYAILDAAAELGVNHIDTSNVYGMGRSETAIGAWLAANPDQRAKMHIATKGGITRDENNTRCFRNDLAHLEAELDKSLARMGVDYVDLYYIHRREAERPIEEATQALAALVAKGKTRAIGFSEIAPSSLRRAHAVHPVAAVQSEYSLATRFAELGLVQTCAELGTTLVAFSPVGRTLLTDRPVTTARLAEMPFLQSNPRFQAPNLAANIAQTDKFRALAADMGQPAAALAIAWLLAQGAHILPIPGTRSVAHFRELVQGAQLALGPEDLARIAQVLPVGWAHGDRYSAEQWVGPERFC
jgi:aryl-alcohol dehydrogenase-like predicted oxidoreductase